MLGTIVPVPIYIDKEFIKNIDTQTSLMFILVSLIILIIILVIGIIMGAFDDDK